MVWLYDGGELEREGGAAGVGWWWVVGCWGSWVGGWGGGLGVGGGGWGGVWLYFSLTLEIVGGGGGVV